jgi:NADH-quinone oxidoreductase subunit H
MMPDWLVTPFVVSLNVGLIALYALLAVYVERKLAAFIQDRIGPTEVGPNGIFQTLADIVKLLHKETIIPALADKPLFIIAPVIIFVSVFTAFVALPLFPYLSAVGFEVGLLLALAIVSVDILGILMAGWASNNKFSMIGAIRSVSQMIAYEVPMGMALFSALLLYGTFDLTEISLMQSTHSSMRQLLLGFIPINGIGGIFSWGIFLYPHLIFTFLLFFIAALAETNRAPFDIPEAESELVAGFHTEYSGFGFAIIFLAEYASMFLFCGIGVILFLGGWNSPLPNLWANPALDANHNLLSLIQYGQLATLTTGAAGTVAGIIWGAFWLITKTWLLVIVMMWVRWSYPRLRPDQLLILAWKYLLPLSFVAVLLSVVVRLLQ